MYAQKLFAGLIVLFVSLPALAGETSIELKQGTPTQQEFVLAAKRALYSRNYELWSVHSGVVIGKYRGKVEMAFILGDEMVVIRNTDHGGVNTDTITKYLKNLRRDFMYELAKYTMAPTSDGDPMKAQALLESIKPTNTGSAPFQVGNLTGTYRANISGRHNSADLRNPTFEVSLVHEGNQLSGTFGSSSKIWGTLDGDTVKFEYFASGGYSGKGVWKIDPGSGNFKGSWNRGEWNMTKLR